MLRGVQMQEGLTEPSGLSVVYSISYDRFQELYRYTTMNDYSNQLDVSQGAFEQNGKLVLDNLATGTARSVGKQTTNFRHTFVPEVEGGESAWEVQASRDGGENWLLLERRTYRRVPATNEYRRARVSTRSPRGFVVARSWAFRPRAAGALRELQEEHPNQPVAGAPRHAAPWPLIEGERLELGFVVPRTQLVAVDQDLLHRLQVDQVPTRQVDVARDDARVGEAQRSDQSVRG